MKQHTNRFASLIGAAGTLALAISASANLTINTFDNFTSDALYASWSSATIVSGPTAYSITATGYGSNYKYNPISQDGTGNTTVQLTVSLSAANPGAASGKLGPILTLVDGDGTEYNYAWYGQLLGNHLVLTMPITSPTWIGSAGSTPGLNLATLTHMHMQLDPSSYSGQYTVAWEDAQLIGATPPTITITSESYDAANHQFTLTWTSTPGSTYTIWHTSSLSSPFNVLLNGIPSGGASTTYTVYVPAGDTGFLRVQKE